MHFQKPILILLIFFAGLMVVLSACNAPFLPSFQGTFQNRSPITLMAVSSEATPTPTPYQPLAPTPTYIPTAQPTIPPTQQPEPASNSSASNKPVGRLKLPDNQINILLLGSDKRVRNGAFRTDTIVLLSINTTTHHVSLVSFPRDLYIFVPGWTHQRINTAMFHGGFDLMAQTLEYNFGVRPEYYIMVNFKAFREIVNSLGGIEVQVARDYTDEYWDKTYKTIPAGTVHMDGATALWYARARKASNDFDRARRQQEVLQALAKRLLSMNALESAKDLYQIYIDNVTTNLTWDEITPLIPLVVHFRDPSMIKSYIIGPKQVYDWITPGGAMVLLPRQNQIVELLKEALESE
jgi:LCP family protein required for cell wall assembly